ncbi:hypothetical protein [Imperialibacter roseus]|uniref:Uncharacterized protein n=1 Tax=Imperialibacter roseus TaxID=1324217 RepID=A0ABZ0IUS8_9BACT|nr:hypothetical protein [Imperialibacter roseus]WOK08808.1 hypothetical protein RT717_09190 [Imperialibacter roseus]|tara:strand:+ start:26629 stop:27333 length:705 start_codon:yes stop_codon:yes gene_type:complete
MKNSLFLVFMLLLSVSLRAQEGRKFKVRPGEVTKSVIPLSEVFRFASFEYGDVDLVSGSTINALLNYNLLLREMLYINYAGDTVSISPTGTKKITVGGSEFYSFPGNMWVEAIAGDKRLQLGVHQVVGLAKTEVFGEQYRDGITPFRNIERGIYPTYRELYNQKARYCMLLTKQTAYYFIDKNKRISRAKRSVIVKLFPKYSNEIKSFIKEKSIKTNQEEDLRQLVAFCHQIGY